MLLLYLSHAQLLPGTLDLFAKQINEDHDHLKRFDTYEVSYPPFHPKIGGFVFTICYPYPFIF
jgi:hypothetical protein